jgi:hypothetical protein
MAGGRHGGSIVKSFVAGALLLAGAFGAWSQVAAQQAGRITPAGVARAQAVVDSVFLDRRLEAGTIEGGDWASYLMVRLGVNPLPDSVGMVVAVDTLLITFSGRIQDLPPDAQAMVGPLSALIDPATVISAEVELVPAAPGLAHFRLRGVKVGAFPVPETMLRSMLFEVGEQYPALTKSGRDLYVQIPSDGKVVLGQGVVVLKRGPTAPGNRQSGSLEVRTP